MSLNILRNFVIEEYDYIYNQCKFVTKNEEEAKDLAQDVVLKILKVEDKFTSKSGVKTYISTTVRTLHIDKYRYSKTIPKQNTDNFEQVKLYSEQDHSKIMLREIESTKLTSKQSKVMQDIISGVTYKEVQSKYNLSKNTVGPMIHKIRNKVIKLLELKR